MRTGIAVLRCGLNRDARYGAGGNILAIELMEAYGCRVPVVSGDGMILSAVPSASALIGTSVREYGTDRVAVDKNNVAEDFFTLRNRLAGAISQKFLTYRVKIAIYGDFPAYAGEAFGNRAIFKLGQTKEVQPGRNFPPETKYGFQRK